MVMPYTTNPNVPRLRMEAAKLVINSGWSTRQVARHYRYDHSTVVRWVQRARITNRHEIPTESSRPHSHPDQLTSAEEQAILLYRYQYRRCAEVIHHYLTRDGYSISLSSVKRTLKRHGLIYPSKWKKWHQYPPRPIPKKPGVLVQIDTMQSGQSPDCLRAYALIDVCSRWVYATPVTRANTWNSWRTTKQALRLAPFKIQTIQSDHGSEFSKWYTKQLLAHELQHRHSRVRKPTDNSHIERFMRTLQQECLKRIPQTMKAWKRSIPQFVQFYNAERPHMALNMKTPNQVVQSY
jgi:transposase InsO family protein